MIKNITAGPGIQVSNSYNTWPAFYNTSSASNNTLIGQMRYNGSTQNMEVYDGTAWLTLTSTYQTIELSPHVQSVVNWAQCKMAEESRIKELAKTNPALQDAIEALQRAEEQVKIVAALVQQ